MTRDQTRDLIRTPDLPDARTDAADEITDDLTLAEVDLHDTTAVDGATYVDIRRSHLRRVALTGATVENLRLVDVILEDCELSGAVLVDAVFTRVRLVRCRMAGFTAAAMKATDVQVTECKLDGANFRHATIERAAFTTCGLREADFYGAKLTTVDFDNSDLTSAELSKTKLDKVDLRGSILDGLKIGDSLKGATIGEDQVVQVAYSLFASFGVTVASTQRVPE